MPVLTANIAFLFADRPFTDRIAAAKRAGFDRVECHFPYEVPVPELRSRLGDAGVWLTGLNTRPGEAGEWGRAGVPGREELFRQDFAEALGYATALGASVIHVMAGKLAAGADRAAALGTYVSNLRWAGREAAGTGVTLVLEPLNTRDQPGFLVSRSDEIVGLIEEIGEGNVKLLFDAYHVQIMEGDLTRRLERHLPVVGHVQIAAVPSRAEPDEGEIDFRDFFRTLDRVGYGGLVGLEYKPRGGTEEGLGWRAALGIEDGRAA